MVIFDCNKHEIQLISVDAKRYHTLYPERLMNYEYLCIQLSSSFGGLYTHWQIIGVPVCADLVDWHFPVNWEWQGCTRLFVSFWWKMFLVWQIYCWMSSQKTQREMQRDREREADRQTDTGRQTGQPKQVFLSILSDLRGIILVFFLQRQRLETVRGDRNVLYFCAKKPVFAEPHQSPGTQL